MTRNILIAAICILILSCCSWGKPGEVTVKMTVYEAVIICEALKKSEYPTKDVLPLIERISSTAYKQIDTLNKK